MTTKLWISDKLELMYSPTGWPQRPINEDDYQKALDKAKSESLVVNGFPEGMTLLNIATRDLKPGDFIDLPIEVEIGWQYYAHEWRDCIGDPMNYLDYMTRQVARLKPVNSAHGFSEGSEFSSDSTKVFPAGTGMWFPEKQIEDLKSKLDAANARIKELDNESIDNFEKFQEAMINKCNLKERILNAFEDRCKGHDYPYTFLLSEVLDELGIK